MLLAFERSLEWQQDKDSKTKQKEKTTGAKPQSRSKHNVTFTGTQPQNLKKKEQRTKKNIGRLLPLPALPIVIFAAYSYEMRIFYRHNQRCYILLHEQM